MKRKNCAKLSFSSDDRGVTIVAVIIALVFVATLGSILLFMATTNVQTKSVDRQGKETFYNAETVLNEICTAVQSEVSRALEEAYTQVLINYYTFLSDGSLNMEDREADFRKEFRKALTAEKINTILNSYIIDDKVNVTWDPIVLADAGEPIILKNIKVDYYDGGYRSAVSTDIVIKVPSFDSSQSAGGGTAPQNYKFPFTIVAGGDLSQNAGGDVTVDGSVYAKSITVSGTDNTMQFTGKQVICALEDVKSPELPINTGLVSVKDNAQLTISADTEMWANRIVVGNKNFTDDDMPGRVALNGSTYVADDLELVNNDSAAVLSGRYVGFGDGPAANQSSSIIINGTNAILNMQDLSELRLAGLSYIHAVGDDIITGGDVRMGESISVKSNQMAYLIPEQCLEAGTRNPDLYLNAELNDTNLKNKVLFGKSVNALGGKKLSDFGINSTGSTQLVYRSLPGNSEQTLVYFYVQLPNSIKANEYLSAYFNAGKSPSGTNTEYDNYLARHSQEIVYPNIATTATTGHGFSFNSEGAKIKEAVGAVYTAYEKNTYKDLCDTFSDYVIEEGINGIIGDTNSLPVGEVHNPTVLIKNGNYTINDDTYTPATVGIIIATGDVTVKREYNGIIICGGNVTLEKSVIEDKAIIQTALNTEGLEAYLKLESDGSGGGTGAGNNGAWDMSELVYYQNWSKD